jgi:hypothetical protein
MRVRSPLLSPEGTGEAPDDKPLTERERVNIMRRVSNFEHGHDTGLTDRAVLYLRGYEATVRELSAAVSRLTRERDEARDALLKLGGAWEPRR